MTNENLTAGSVPSPAFYRLASDQGRPLSTSQPQNSFSFDRSDEDLGIFPGPRPGGPFCGYGITGDAEMSPPAKSLTRNDEELGIFPGPRPGGPFCGYGITGDAEMSPPAKSLTRNDEELGMSGYPRPCQGGFTPCIISSDEELSVSMHQMQQCFGCISGDV